MKLILIRPRLNVLMLLEKHLICVRKTHFFLNKLEPIKILKMLMRKYRKHTQR